MKKNLLSAVILFTAIFATAQTRTNYWVVLKDKNNSPFSLDAPKAFLSERSIARRERMHISLNMRDLPVNPAYIADLRAHGAVIINRSKWYNAVTVSIPDATKLPEISALPFVKTISRIVITPSAGPSKFDEENALTVTDQQPLQQRTSYNYGPSYNQAHMLGADCMHQWGYTGEGVVIAELDAGFYNANILPAFDSLFANNQILGCRDFVTGDTLVFEDYPHGMNVLSCMGGNIPGSIVGTAPKAKFWLLRTEEAASESIQEEINWMVGAEFADSVGADIITSSLGYSRFDDTTTNHTYADMDGNTTICTKAADWAAAAGIFVVIAAGNEGSSSWGKITAPSDADSVLTIGAVDAGGVVTSFSSRGPTSDGRIKPTTMAQGGAAITAANGGGITVNSGTSFATPITAGAVACLIQANPLRTNMELMQAIIESADRYASPDTVYGNGIPNFCFANSILAGIHEEQQNNEALIVYPNPFNSSTGIRFYSAKKQTATLLLMDVSGRMIGSKQFVLEANTDNRSAIPSDENLAAGIYVLQLRTTDGIFTQKIVKE